MLSSIHPLGERAKGNRWGVTATAFVLGSIAGGLMVGGLAGALGQALDLPQPVALAAVGAALVAAVMYDLRLFGLRLPTTRRQVDENWLNRYRGWVYGVGYGLQLGAGVVTVVNTAATYAALVIAFATGSVAGGLVIGGAFGLIRGLAILPARRITSPRQLREFHGELHRRAGLTARFAPLAELMVALSIAGTMVVR